MKFFLILFVVGALGFVVIKYFLNKPNPIKPILPTVFFESADNPNSLVFDFGSCAAGQGTTTGDFGSVKFEMWSISIKTCRLDYFYKGKENLAASCLVPKSLDKRAFEKDYKGVDFSQINKYCMKV